MTINVRRSKKDMDIGLRYRVIADGRDVTNGCWYVDARRRVLKLNKLDVHGESYLEWRNGEYVVATEYMKARRVRLVPRVVLHTSVESASMGGLR